MGRASPLHHDMGIKIRQVISLETLLYGWFLTLHFGTCIVCFFNLAKASSTTMFHWIQSMGTWDGVNVTVRRALSLYVGPMQEETAHQILHEQMMKSSCNNHHVCVCALAL